MMANLERKARIRKILLQIIQLRIRHPEDPMTDECCAALMARVTRHRRLIGIDLGQI